MLTSSEQVHLPLPIIIASKPNLANAFNSYASQVVTKFNKWLLSCKSNDPPSIQSFACFAKVAAYGLLDIGRKSTFLVGF